MKLFNLSLFSLLTYVSARSRTNAARDYNPIPYPERTEISYITTDPTDTAHNKCLWSEAWYDPYSNKLFHLHIEDVQDRYDPLNLILTHYEPGTPDADFVYYDPND